MTSSYNVQHQVADIQYQAMLLPFGYYRNADLAEARIGAMIVTDDEPKCHLQIKTINVIPVNSPVTDAMSMLIYGLPIETVFGAMRGKYGSAIFNDKLIFIVYEHISTDPYDSGEPPV